MTDLDLSLRPGPLSKTSRDGLALLAILATLLLHGAVAAWLLINWHRAPTPEPPPIVATLVRLPPPPPPAPAPEPKPPQPMKSLESGPDQHTTEKAPATEKAPEETTPPPPPPAPTQPAPTPTPEPATTAAPTPDQIPAPPPPPPEKPVLDRPRPPEPKKLQEVMRAPELAPPDRNFTLGERDETGDPYLNLLQAMIDSHRPAATPVGPLGLRLAGTATFRIEIERNGSVSMVELVQSSGAPELDNEIKRMIVSAVPFPPLPANYPVPTLLTATIPLY